MSLIDTRLLCSKWLRPSYLYVDNTSKSDIYFQHAVTDSIVNVKFEKDNDGKVYSIEWAELLNKEFIMCCPARDESASSLEQSKRGKS